VQDSIRGVIAGQSAGGAPACATAQDAETDATAATKWLGNVSGRKYYGSGFVVGSTEDDQSGADDNYTICKAIVRMYTSADSPSNNVRACVYDNNGGEPGSLVGTCSDWVVGSTISTSEQDVSFENMSADVVNGTTYYLVLEVSAVGTPYYLLAVESSGNLEDQEVSPDAATWTNDSAVYTIKYILYSN